MSDLINLFTHRNNLSPPLKRALFTHHSQDKNISHPRSSQPRKSIRKSSKQSKSEACKIQSSRLRKRYLQKEDMKKQMSHYNTQMRLIYMRKLFFILSAILILNIVFASSSILLLFNILLALAFLQTQFGKDILGNGVVVTSREIIKVIVYSLNFNALFAQIQGFQSISLGFDKMSVIISLNAALNYFILKVYSPLIALHQVQNTKAPYNQLKSQVITQFARFFKSIQIIFHFKRPILFLNFTYWLSVIGYIAHTRSQQLVDRLINLQTVLAMLLATLLLYTLVYAISKMSDIIIIELLSPNKRSIYLNLLRLDCQNQNNQMITHEVVKYIWNNCELIWDTQLLAHNYDIKYDILEDYLNLELRRIHDACLNVQKNIQKSRQSRSFKTPKKPSFLESLMEQYIQVRQMYRLLGLLHKKIHLFYMVEHIFHFEAYSDDYPINTKLLEKTINRMDFSLKIILQNVSILEIKESVRQFYFYFHQNLHQSNDYY